MESHDCKDVVLDRVGCTGKCDMEPIVTVITQGVIPTKYIFMNPERVDRVFESHILRGIPVEEFTMRRAAHLNTVDRVVSVCAPNNTPEIRDAFLRSVEGKYFR